jgi:hypothetical protein
MMMSLATMVTIQSQQWWLLPFYWLLMSPLPRFMRLPSADPVFDIVPRYSPFSVKKLVEEMEKFLQPVRTGQRVLMAFADPQGIYNRIFDGYRTLLELPLYVAAERGVHFMPDWWAVFETNYQGAPDFWGRDIRSVEKNAEQWKPDFVVVYQDAGTRLDPTWQAAGFDVMGSFSWANYTEELRGEKPYIGAAPQWWLLKVPVLIPEERSI